MPRKIKYILVVEDNEEILAYICQVISKLTNYLRENKIIAYDIEIIGFAEPLKAIDWYRCNNKKTILVVTDLKMPLMSGNKMIIEMNKIRKTNVIVQTAYIDMLGLDIDQNYIIRKPLRRNKIIEAICSKLGLRITEDEINKKL